MIEEYLQLQNMLTQHTIMIGRALREFKHYGCFGYETLVASPWASNVTPDYVEVVMGFRKDKSLGTIQVPTKIFENGNSSVLKNWVEKVNEYHFKSAEEIKAEIEDTNRQHELAIMHELMTKYPQEAANHD